MKKWRFFPILVKEEVLKNMDLSDKLSFSKCSKKCLNLLRRVPNHLDTFEIPDDNRLSIDDFLMLNTSPKSIVQLILIIIETTEERDQVEEFLSKIQKLIKVKAVVIDSLEYSRFNKKVIELCDPSFMKSIQIENLESQETYEDISKTPQWKNSENVSLNWLSGKTLEINIDDFLHFNSIKLRVEELSVDDAWKLVQKTYSTGSVEDSISIGCKKPLQVTLIRQKIESELVGDWKSIAYFDVKYLIHPENPHLVLKYICELKSFYVGLVTLEKFNRDWID